MKTLQKVLAIFTAALSLGLIAAWSSRKDGADKTRHADDNLYVREIRVTGEGDGIFDTNLEVEVHLYEYISQDSARFLGCSGENQGLRSVDVSEILYLDLSAYFEKPNLGGRVTLADIQNKQIFLITGEDDANRCPVEFGVGDQIGNSDDLIGKSAVFAGAQLAKLQLKNFGRVVHILIGVGDYQRPGRFTDRSTLLGSTADASNGACWGDFDNNGAPDLFVANGRRSPTSTTNDKNQLFLNRGDGSFTEVTSGPVVTDDGNSTGCTCGDYDNDGDLDLYVTNIGPNFLYANNGNATFTRITQGDIVTDNLASTAAAWGDFDRDGDLDLFVANAQDQGNLLYVNNGNGSFAKADPSSSVVSERSHATGCNWVDYDGDGDPDLFVTNTDRQRNFLYRNLGNGAFVKVTVGALVADDYSSRGASWGDYDNDGDLDVFVADSSSQSGNLYTNNGNGTFSKPGRGDLTKNLSSYVSSWGDLDNDSDVDVAGPGNEMFLNSISGSRVFWRLAGVNVSIDTSGRSLSWVDYDLDGQLDVYIARHAAQNKLYRNEGGNNNWLKVRCRGTVSNRSGIGAKVLAKVVINGSAQGGVWQLVEISAQTGHGGHGNLEAHFGLAEASTVDSLVVKWPSGRVDVRAPVAVNQTLTIIESGGTAVDENTNAAPATFILGQNYPNPFLSGAQSRFAGNPETTIEYAIPPQATGKAEVTLRIYNLQGQLVRTLVEQRQPAGRHVITWDGRDEQNRLAASGVFLYQLQVGNLVQTRKLALVR